LKNTNTPYSNLDPNVILDAIEHAGFRCTSSLLPLNSYENRVYQVGIENAPPLIAKFYRPNRWSDDAINEEHQFALELMHHEIPVVAPLVDPAGTTLHHFQGFRFALFPKQSGRSLELDNLEHLEWVGRLMGRLHAIGNCHLFHHRLHLDVQNYGYIPYQFLLEHDFIPLDIKNSFCITVDSILERIKECFDQVGVISSLRLHGDCHAGNILWHNTGPQIVDLDDCLNGPAIQDLWMMITGNTKPELSLQLQKILRGYNEFNDFNHRELYLIEALRTLRMIHYSAWLAKRWEDPAFPLNFPWFNTQRYWLEQLQHLNEQIVLLEQTLKNMN
jgi:Ser/Thr protein kinase RdoA (MazF antagonist)